MQNPFTKSAITQSAIAAILIYSGGTFAANEYIKSLGFSPDNQNNQLYVLSLQRNVFPTITGGIIAAILLNESTKKKKGDLLKDELKGLLKEGRISPDTYANIEVELDGNSRAEIRNIYN